MNPRCTVPIVFLIAFVLLGVGYLAFREEAEVSAVKPEPTGTMGIPQYTATVSPATLGHRAGQVLEYLENHADLLRLSDDQEMRDELIDNLRSDLAATVAEDAVAAITAFLQGGTDATTGQPFEVSSSGHLETAPTLRSLLIDSLSQLSVPAAAEFARELLGSSPISAAEWALALRDYARGNHLTPVRGTDPFFRAKVHELLAHSPWSVSPTPEFLYAMDAAVFSGDATSARLLASLTQNEHPAVQRVAFDKLSRLAYDDFAALAPVLQSSPEFVALSPRQRGILYAYADIREPVQREIIEQFLASESPAIEAFADTFPNFTLGIASELLTEIPPRDELDDIDAVLAAWEASKAWATATPAFAATTARLDRIVRSIEAGIADR